MLCLTITLDKTRQTLPEAIGKTQNMSDRTDCTKVVVTIILLLQDEICAFFVCISKQITLLCKEEIEQVDSADMATGVDSKVNVGNHMTHEVLWLFATKQHKLELNLESWC